jgi:SAM-dependent methyltransferase
MRSAASDSASQARQDSRTEERENADVIPSFKVVLAKFGNSFRKRKGIFGTLKSCAEEIEDIWFDWKFGIRTLVTASDRTSPPKSFGIPYAPTKVKRLKQILGQLRVSHEQFTFLDIGSGKGRALLVASEFPFRRIIGVEILPELHFAAEENLRSYRSTTQKCRVIELFCCDATDYCIPAEDTVLFLSNPFESPIVSHVLAQVRESLQSHPRQFYVVYHNPVCHDLIVQTDLFEIVFVSKFHAIYKNKMPARASVAANQERSPCVIVTETNATVPPRGALIPGVRSRSR